MRRFSLPPLALALLVLIPSAGPADDSITAGDGVERLAVSFFTAGLLAEVTAQIEADRLDQAKLTGGYLAEKTGLIWTRTDNGTDLDWYEADDYCRDLEVAEWTDWRMPSIDELEELHDRRSNASYKLPPAIRLTGCCPWSRSLNGDSSAWNFSFRYRKRFSGSLNYSFELRALCVRGATEADLLFFEQAAEKAKEAARRR